MSPGSTDGNPIKNVTSRKKPRPKPIEEDSDDEISGSSSAKKKRYNRTNSNGAGPSSRVRRNLNLSFLPAEAKKRRSKAHEVEANEGESLEAAVTRILESHLLLRKFINAANCFEHKTILDIINNDLVRHESMADMAMILNSAVEVYGFRVDRCYLHVQDTRGHITSTFNPKHGHNDLHNDSMRGSPRRRRRDDIKQNIGDWKARLTEDGEQELNIADEEEEEGSGRRHIPEEDSENFMDNIPTDHEELNNFLDDLMAQRKTINDKIHSVNTHIVEDGDDLMDKTNKELSSNEYYQKAVSRYGEGNSAAMLMNNAKFSSESQAYLIHSRITPNETKITESLNYDFIKQIKETLANSLSAAPKKIEKDLLPALDEVYHNSDVDTDEEDNFTATAADEITEANVGIENLPRSPKNKASELRRSIVFRGKNMTIERTWVADDITLNLAPDLYGNRDKEDLTRLEKTRTAGVDNEEKSKLPAELELSTIELKERSKYFEISGIDEDVRELDNLWNSQIVKTVVTTEEMVEMIRLVEDSRDSLEEIHNKKLRILQPGDYVFFVGSDAQENPLIPVDDWKEESADPVLELAGNDVFYDAEDDFGGAGDNEELDLPNEAEPDNIEHTNRPIESIVDDVRIAMERDTPNEEGEPGETVHLEDIADVPVNPGMIPDKLDEAIRNMGKEDNAHWKGSKTAEVVAGDNKKQKKTRVAEDKSVHIDEYWAASDAELRRKAACKYSARPSHSIEKTENLIFLPRPASKNAFSFYDFEDFNKITCLNGEMTYSGNTWDNSMRTVELINKPMSLYDVAAFNEDGDECMGLEWMRALRGIKLKRPADELSTSMQDADAALLATSALGSVSGDEPGMEYNPDIENIWHDHNYENTVHYEVDSPGLESYHTAPAGSNSPDQDFNQAIETLPWVTRKNKLQEIRDLQAAEDIEEEGEIAEGLEGTTAIIIKNTSIDQSKVKSYLKNILTNRMMDKKCLKTVTEAASDQEFLDQTVTAVRELTLMNPGQDISMMNRSFEFKDTGIDPLEVSRVVFTAPDQQTQTGQGLNASTNQDGPSQEALTNAVVLSDFNIQGEHSLSSIMACLPFRAQRNNEKNMHVALLFSIALQMCNENTLHCMQPPTTGDASSLGDFVLRNGASPQINAPVDVPRPKRPVRVMQEVIPEVDETNLDDSTTH